MGVKIEYTHESPTSYVAATSRYVYSKVILLGERAVPAFSLYRKDKGNLFFKNIQWSEITPSVEFRPDLVSQELYGTPDFWWKLLEINNMKDILEFRAGRVIMVPDTMLT